MTEALSVAKPAPYMPTKAGTEDWCTPAEVLEPVRRVFGGHIDLDPCSNPHSIVCARRSVMLPKWREAYERKAVGEVLTQRVLASIGEAEEVIFADGLEVAWRGSTYVNPPYSAKPLGAFMAKASLEARRGVPTIMLTPSKTDLRAWQAHVPSAAAICFIKGRLDFIVPGGTGSACGTSAPMATALVLWTTSRELVHRFALELDGKLGHVVFTR